MSLWGKDIKVWDLQTPDPGNKIRNKIAAGELIRVHGRYYIDKTRWENLEPWNQDWLRARAVGKQAFSAVLVGRSAAIMWGLAVIGYGEPVELALRNGGKPPARSQWPENVRYRSTKFLAGDIQAGNGYYATNWDRTLIDVCRWHGFENGLVAVESAYRKKFPIPKLAQKAEAMRGKHGMKHVRRVLEFAGPGSESPLESLAKAKLIDAQFDLSKFTQNKTLWIEGEKFRPDFLYQGWLFIELDGWRKYTGDFGDPAEVLLAEKRREDLLRNSGLDSLRAGWKEVQDGTFIRQLRAKIAARTSRGGF